MKGKKHLFGVFGIVLLLVFDQFTKYQAVHFLKDTQGFSVIPGIFKLQYLENHGAAFGILQNQRWPLLLVTILILTLLGILYCKIPDDKRYQPLRIVGIMLAAGAVGNMFDRLLWGYVVDFLYFELIHFPIFNVADCYVVIAAFVAFFLVCFYYKDEDLEKIKNGK